MKGHLIAHMTPLSPRTMSMSLCMVGLSDNVEKNLPLHSIDPVSAIVTPHLATVCACQLVAFLVMKWFCVTRSLYVGAGICYRDGNGVNFNIVVVNTNAGGGDDESRSIRTQLIQLSQALRGRRTA